MSHLTCNFCGCMSVQVFAADSSFWELFQEGGNYEQIQKKLIVAASLEHNCIALKCVNICGWQGHMADIHACRLISITQFWFTVVDSYCIFIYTKDWKFYHKGKKCDWHYLNVRNWGWQENFPKTLKSRRKTLCKMVQLLNWTYLGDILTEFSNGIYNDQICGLNANNCGWQESSYLPYTTIWPYEVAKTWGV